MLLTNRGALHLARGQTESARIDLTAAIALKPREVSARLILAQLSESVEDFAQAQAQYDMVIALQPQRPELYRTRAGFHVKRRNLAQALADYEQAITLGKPRPTRSLAQDCVERGRILQNLDRLPEALAAFDEALAVQADHREAHHGRLWVLLNLDSHDDILRSCDALLTQGNLSLTQAGEFHELRGLARAARRNLPGTLTDYTMALAAHPTNLALLVRRGNAYLAADAPLSALADFQRAVVLNPKHGEARNGSALAHVRLLDWEQALTEVEYGLRCVDPKDTRLVYLAATVFAQASAVTEFGAKTVRPQDSLAYSRQFADRAMGQLKSLLDQIRTGPERQRFWQTHLKADEGRKDMWYLVRNRSDFLALEQACRDAK